ncbi:helicase RepA family protein [Sinorhizobium sp. M103]|uniref:AAA family ATPase n=1 Tax=Sinorhizobium sp. M103 TaxID=2976821 RepID=UPI0023D8574C|nr:AAA family ATPase [Sinorhizobium sp. M103]WEJ11580.1 helicase RepA family protein [Sinorhizobium sp. M103]
MARREPPAEPDRIKIDPHTGETRMDYDPPKENGQAKFKANGADNAKSNGEDKADRKKPRFELIPLSEIKPDEAAEFRIDRLLPRLGLACIYGPPGCGKSFLAIYMGLSIAAKRLFFGCETKQCGVVYIAAEAGTGIKKRIAAARDYLNITDDVPFYLITGAPNLGFRGPKDCKALVDSITAANIPKEQGGVGVIIIDTVARVTPGTDENKASEFGAFINNADSIGRHFRALVVGVHHSGKDESRGMRGSNVFNGATDCEWAVRKQDGMHSATVGKMRDGEDGIEFSFRLEVRDVGNGRTTCIVSEQSDVAPTSQKKSKRPPLKGAALTAWHALNEALDELGEVPPESNHVPSNTRTVSIDQWRDYAKRRGISMSDLPRALNLAFQRAVEKLRDNNMIGIWNDRVWVV